MSRQPVSSKYLVRPPAGGRPALARVLLAGVLATAVPVARPHAAAVSKPALDKTLPASWDENWFGSPAVYDLDGDGDNEIIAGRHSVLYVWSAAGGLLWSAPVGEQGSQEERHGTSRQYAAPVVGDLDGDGDGEIAIAYGHQVALYAYDGNLVTGWPREFPGPEGEIRSIAGADLDGDGTVEVLAVKTSDGPVTMAWHADGTPVDGWPQVDKSAYPNAANFGGYNQNVGAADLDGDGTPEVISSYDICHIGIMYADGSPCPADEMFADAGPWAASVPLFHDLSLATQGWGADMSDRDEFTDSPPCFGDLDGDSMPEVVLYSDHERAGEYVNRGNCLWALNPDMTRVPGFETPLCSEEPLYTGYEDNIVQVCPAPALADLAGDRRPEIVVPSYDGTMRCFSPDGDVLWEHAFDTAGDPFVGASGATIGGLNNDGSCEIVFATYAVQEDVSHLVVLDAGGDSVHAVPLSRQGSMSPPTLADVDGDGVLEIVVSLKRVLEEHGVGGVQIWKVASAVEGKRPWP
ncbi:MAG: hypothetical protein GF418_17380, partial [Chitinivibrionales bacterium]|nr:hypothetical protein [Chitinivibrionales bacterium]MBD3397393.1 hypothetical protein [Chitinivibrionales bacterium]